MDMTVYLENIPSNQIENWIKIQSDRFVNPVIRGFHTELETVYEEKNMTLTQDGWKVYEKILSSLFPNHPYGTQTVIGTQEHLKNPSITEIKKFFNTYYVANNMAICMSGDFDPDKTIRIIDRYMRKLPKGDVPKLEVKAEKPITEPIAVTVLGNETEYVTIGYRIPGESSIDTDVREVLSFLLNNGTAGLIDINLVQQQRVLAAYSGSYSMADHSAFVLQGLPKEGQTLDEVKELLLEQIDLLKKGEFDDDLLQAVIDNFRLNEIYRLQSNNARANMFVSAFINGISWENASQKLNRQAKLTSKDIVEYANRYFGDNYVIVYKERGRDPNELRMPKPEITPIELNRDLQSPFLASIIDSKVPEIEPVFIDYQKDINKTDWKPQIPILYVQNAENNTSEILYRYRMGSNNDNLLGTAFNYLKFLGTSKYTPEQIRMEFYKLACSFNVSSGSDFVFVSLSGLADNMEKALVLLEELLADAQVNEPAFVNLVADIKKSRSDAKLNQQAIFSYLRNYAIWGKNSSMTNVPSANELDQLTGNDLVARIKDLANYPHQILYYGPLSQQELSATLDKHRKISSTLRDYPPAKVFVQQSTDENKVYFAHYDAQQLFLSMVTKSVPFDRQMHVPVTMFNRYFSGDMSAIVFQEMREARGLAYSASANYMQPARPNQNYVFTTFIATQNDKMDEALEAFLSIINDMPQSQASFELARDQIVSNLRRQRIRRMSILHNYLDAQEFEWQHDRRKDLFEKAPAWTLEDVAKFQQEYLKDLKYVYCVLGNENDLVQAVVDKYGTLHKLSLEEIFGF
jgi:predicted Zn-dependent peptidase